MTAIAWRDGALEPLSQATVPLADRGHLLGDGVFETLRAAQGKVFLAGAHEARLRAGLATLSIDHPQIVSSYRAAVEALAASNLEALPHERVVRVQVTRGVDGGPPAVTGLARPLPERPQSVFTSGVSVGLAQQVKHRADPLSRVKAVSFLPYLQALRTAQAAGFDDAILPNETGRLAEATTANLLARCGNQVLAPGAREGALPGTIRRVTLDLLGADGYDVEHRLDESTLLACDEAWLANTTGLAIPVTRFNHQPVGSGAPGRLSRALPERLMAWLEAHGHDG